MARLRHRCEEIYTGRMHTKECNYISIKHIQSGVEVSAIRTEWLRKNPMKCQVLLHIRENSLLVTPTVGTDGVLTGLSAGEMSLSSA